MTAPSRCDIDVYDVEYIRHENKPLLARVYRPQGTGPFPLVVDVHGGAWSRNDRTRDVGTDEPLARSGVVVVSLDFRMAPQAAYPAAVVDVNYAIRWCKAHAGQLASRPDRVGLLGFSSGGHIAMLAAMRPHDDRYAALSVPGNAMVDASVHCVVLCWPVIDPLGRYQYAKELRTRGPSKAADAWIKSHDLFWQTEAAMAEGNPALAVERGEEIRMPPALYIQGTADKAHPRPHCDRFIASYQKAGGRIELHLAPDMGQAFIADDPRAPESVRAIDRIIEFVHAEMK